jgi:hypothetical protein
MRVSVSVKRRLERLELTLAIGRPIGLWPTILSCTEWEAIAMPMQLELTIDTKH